MQQVSGQLYKRVDKSSERPVRTEPIAISLDRSSAADTVTDAVLCHTASESSLTIASEQPKGAEWPAGLLNMSYKDSGPQSRARAASPSGSLQIEFLLPSHALLVDIPTHLTASMRPAEAAHDPAACHATFIDLEAGAATSTMPTAMTAAAHRPARPVAPDDAVDSDMASDAMRHHHDRVEWAGGTQGTAPAAAADEAAAAGVRIDPSESSALNVPVPERGLCPGAAQSSSSAEPSVGVAAQDDGKGGAWPAGGACFVCQDAAADAVLIECGHGGLCSGDVLDENTEREGGRRREGYEASSIAESAGLWQPDCAARTLSL